MRFSTALIFAVAGLAAAQSSDLAASPSSIASSPGGKCQAQNILEACLTSTKGQLESCAGNDYGCLCDQYTNVLTCYNNCPNDSGRTGVEQQKTQNCAAAKQYGKTSSVPKVKPTATKGAKESGASGSASATAAGTGFGVASGSGSASTSTSTGAAGRLTVEAGGMLALVAAGFGLYL